MVQLLQWISFVRTSIYSKSMSNCSWKLFMMISLNKPKWIPIWRKLKVELIIFISYWRINRSYWNKSNCQCWSSRSWSCMKKVNWKKWIIKNTIMQMLDKQKKEWQNLYKTNRIALLHQNWLSWAVGLNNFSITLRNFQINFKDFWKIMSGNT